MPEDHTQDLFYDAIANFACSEGADRVLAVVRDWFTEQAAKYPPGTAHYVAYLAVGDGVEDAREYVIDVGAKDVNCSSLPQADGNGRAPGEVTELSDGT